MQIFEVTLPSEYIGGLAKKAGTGLMQAGKTAATGVAQAGQKAAGAIAQSQPVQDIKKIGSAVAGKNVGRGLISGLTGVDIPQSQASIDKDAAAAAEKLRAQGYGQPPKAISVQDAIAGVKKNTAQQQFIKGLVAQWQQQAPKPSPAVEPTPDVGATVQPGVTTPPGGPEVTAAKTKTQVRPTYGTPSAPTVSFAGQRGQRPLDPKNPSDAKIIAQLKSQGKLNEAPINMAQNVASARAARAASRNPPTSTAVDPYKDAFLKWAAGNLKTVEPSTRQSITLDQIYKTDMKDELDRALAQVVATAGDAQRNAVAVNNFLTIAVAGVARESTKLKQSYGRGGEAGAVDTGQAGQAIVTRQELLDKLGNIGVNANQLQSIQSLVQDPATKQALLKSLGVRA